jgi:uncharacterized protein (DUF362 family)
MKQSSVPGRREFLKTSLFAGLAAATVGRTARPARAVETGRTDNKSRVALEAGDDRADNVFRGLAAFREEIARAIGDRQVVIKPNNVSIEVQLAATHADCLEGILEFLKSIDKLAGVVIAESSANGPTLEGFSNFGYPRLAEKYGVKLVDLDKEPTETIYVFDEKDFRPHAVRMSQRLLDPESFIISAAMPKTHDRVLATLSLKNVVFGAPVKDPGFRWGRKRTPGKTTQKPIAHGSGIYGINYNLFTLAQRLHPDLAVIDGFVGMEGNGPTGGSPVDHRVAVVSPDWLAADRVAVELMGIELSKIGYLTYCGEAKMGETDLGQIDIVGDPIARHVRKYKLHKNAEKQLAWKTPPEQA